jgi:hypothetical protein
MRKVTGIVAVLLLMIIINGCAAGKMRSTEEGSGAPEMSYENVLQRVVENNIVSGGFVIQKGSIELRGTPVEGEFGFNAKLNNLGDMVLSVRGPLGIELVRFLAVGNELCMIDRLGRTVYLGKKDEIMSKYGLPAEFALIIFGDFAATGYKSIARDGEGRIIIEYDEGLRRRVVTICADGAKKCKESIVSDMPEGSIELAFGDFKTDGILKYPGEITIQETNRLFHMKLNIEQFKGGFTDPIEFVFPQYRRKPL